MNSRTQNKIHSTYGLTQQYIFLEILAFNVIFNFEINCSFDERHQGYFVLFGVIINNLCNQFNSQVPENGLKADFFHYWCVN